MFMELGFDPRGGPASSPSAESVPNMVWIADSTGMVEHFNQQGLDYTGQPPEAHVGRSWLELVHADDLESTEAAWRRRHRVRVSPTRSTSASGGPTAQFRWHRSRALPVRDDDGSIEGWIGTAVDIDHERGTEVDLQAALRQNDETLSLLETLQQNAPVGFGYLDTELRIVRQNDVLAAFRGGSAASRRATRLEDVLAELWPERGTRPATGVRTGEPVVNQQLMRPMTTDGGRLHETLNSYYPLHRDGELIGIGVVLVDINERREAEDAQRRLTLAAISAIAAAVEARDPYTAGHQRRVAGLSAAIAREVGLGADESEGIHLAASIHDIGKLGVPAEILAYPRKLTDAEYEVIKTHAQLGHDIVAGIDFPWPIADMILQHHERLDGSGYPNGLHGGDITLGARIIAVADTVEAMASHRPYRPGVDIETALDEIRDERGVLFDPTVVDACIDLFHRGSGLDGHPRDHAAVGPTRRPARASARAGLAAAVARLRPAGQVASRCSTMWGCTSRKARAPKMPSMWP